MKTIYMLSFNEDITISFNKYTVAENTTPTRIPVDFEIV